MATARFVGRGKNQKLVVETEEAGEATITRTDDEENPFLIDFKPRKPKGKEDGNSQQGEKEIHKKERDGFWNPLIDAEE